MRLNSACSDGSLETSFFMTASLDATSRIRRHGIFRGKRIPEIGSSRRDVRVVPAARLMFAASTAGSDYVPHRPGRRETRCAYRGHGTCPGGCEPRLRWDGGRGTPSPEPPPRLTTPGHAIP